MKRDFSAIRRIIAATTGLTFGSISDGQALKRSGTSIIGQNLSATQAVSTIPISDSTNGLLDTWVSGGASVFGDGSDGVGNIAVSTPLSRDMFYTDLTVTSTGTLLPSGYRIFVRGTLTIEAGGVISDDGSAGSGSTGASGLGSRGTLNTDSGAGGNGRSTTGTGVNGAAPSSQVFPNSAASLNGGAGGSASGQAGGTGGVPTIRSASGGSIRAWVFASQGHCAGGNGIYQPGGGGGGGGGGGASVGTGTVASGGGGSGGGSVCIVARIFNNAGTVRANGGAGAAATGTGDGVGGGGGGGAGGWVSICAGKVIAQGTVQANGGSGGSGFGGGNSGQSGQNGFTQVLALCA